MSLPAIFAAGTVGTIIATFARYFIASAIIRVVSAFGIGIISFTAFGLIIDKATELLNSLVFSGNALVTSALEAGGIFDAVSIILSAYVAVYTIKALMGAFRRITYGVNQHWD